MPLSLQAIENGDYSSVLSTGVSASGQSTAVFNAEAIVGTAANDYQAGASTLDAVSSLTSANGVDLTGQQAAAQTQKIAIAIMAIPGVGTAIGGALLAITNAVGYAHAGPGVCTTDPPASLSPGDLQRWPYYTPWQNSVANAAPSGNSWLPGNDPAGSFEDVANRALAYNRELEDNCFSSASLPDPVLLATLIAAWNATHAGPSRTITRQMPSGNIPSPPVPGFDPISYALSQSDPASTKSKISFQVNGGSQLTKVVTLHLPPHPNAGSGTAAQPTATTASTAGSIVKHVAVGTAIVGTVGAVGVGAYALLTHQTFLGVLHSIWGSTGARLIAHVNPLPQPRKTRRSRRRRA